MTSIAVAIPAAIPSPGWSGFQLGPLTVHAYALCILLGIVAGLWLTDRRWKARSGPAGAVWDIAIWAIPFGIIGGRLYHVFSSPDAYFGPGFDGTGDLGLIPQIWRGGLGIWGAVALGLVGAWIGCRRAGVKLSGFMDVAAPGVLLAQAIGRWGNWFNQELFGAPTTLPWGLQIDPSSPNFPAGMAPGTLFHPTFLYECLWNLAGVALLLALDKRFNFRRGMLFWLYVAVYTLGRIWIEMLRIDDAEMISLLGITARLNVWTSALLFIASLVIFVLLARHRRTPADDSLYLDGRLPEPLEAAPSGAAAGNAGPAAAEAPAPAAVPAGNGAAQAAGPGTGATVNNPEISGKNPAATTSTETVRGNLAGTSTEADHAPGAKGDQRERGRHKDAKKK
ncbi:prolipoprotein diacylglyceryl transferase [Arthrobacter sp. I2-34]|uniref:Phosphatidylglycerol--prolipoprotein diacylglyceryl transferase n=1 Tax=Arthrobacter hankyongi TaxID=2904801 RepID=A0ABS9LBM5_9MICC|nr:prolipoprotein diacylglyceryl transferase [Arthrobacter hankyongi]MCG2624083.1 prolipoprotein diacylglyceryl transferase [Arthrobacter hankyongi]